MQISAGLGDAFEPGRDVDRVAQQVACFRNQHIADGDADAEQDPALARTRGVLGIVGVLNLDGAARGVDGAVEFRQDRVARGIEHASLVLAHQIGERLRELLKAMNRIVFVLGDEPAVAGNVGRKDDGQLSSHDRVVREIPFLPGAPL